MLHPAPCIKLGFANVGSFGMLSDTCAILRVGVFVYGIGVGDVARGATVVACARARSVSGLRTTFSNVNRFRAEMGGQFRIKTESSMRSSTKERENQ